MGPTIVERTCPLCKDVFVTPVAYREHLEKKHGPDHAKTDPEFACADCGRVFSQYSNMKRHRRTHTGKWGRNHC